MTSTLGHLNLKKVRKPLTKFLRLAAVGAYLFTVASPAEGPLSVKINVTTLQTYSGAKAGLDQAQRQE